MNFDPIEYMKSADVSSKPIEDSSDEAVFRDYQEKVFSELNVKKSAGGSLAPVKVHKQGLHSVGHHQSVNRTVNHVNPHDVSIAVD